MTKILLVEDDNNLREIYEARLLAEGYEIISAKDGEQALALAQEQSPDLIISDVMMPKISGFDMLDLLRSAPKTKDTKVIMMTALSQAEDKDRADRLGADRYLVKSQVTLEDVVKVAREVLEPGSSSGGSAPAASPAPTQQVPVASPTPVAQPAAQPVPAPAATPATSPAPAQQTPAASPTPAATTPIPIVDATTPTTTTPAVAAPTTPTPAIPTTPTAPADTPQPAAAANVDEQIANFMSQAQTATPQTPTATPATPPASTPVPAPEPAALTTPTPATPRAETATGSRRVLEPIHDITTGGADLNALLAKEESANPPTGPTPGIINPTENTL